MGNFIKNMLKISVIIMSMVLIFQMPIQGYSQTIPSDNQITITYSIHKGIMDSIYNSTIQINALNDGILTWEKLNPNLNFIQVEENAEVRFFFIHRMPHNYNIGESKCSTNETITDCLLIISLGNYNCKNRFIQMERDFVTNIVMHEIGHALKIKHFDNLNHLMYGYNNITNDSKNYTIPEKRPEWFIGEEQLYMDIINLTYDITIQNKKLIPIIEKISHHEKLETRFIEKIKIMEKEIQFMETILRIKDGSQYQNTQILYVEKMNEYEEIMNKYDAHVIEYDNVKNIQSLILPLYYSLNEQLFEKQNIYSCNFR